VIPNYHETRKGGQGPIQGCSATKEEEEIYIYAVASSYSHLIIPLLLQLCFHGGFVYCAGTALHDQGSERVLTLYIGAKGLAFGSIAVFKVTATHTLFSLITSSSQLAAPGTIINTKIGMRG
jgi:hypothetical protein